MKQIKKTVAILALAAMMASLTLPFAAAAPAASHSPGCLGTSHHVSLEDYSYVQEKVVSQDPYCVQVRSVTVFDELCNSGIGYLDVYRTFKEYGDWTPVACLNK